MCPNSSVDLRIKNFHNNQHFLDLQNSYSKVGDCTWRNNNFLQKPLQSSRSLFTDRSLLSRNPCPKKLEVYALLSGISFSDKIMSRLQFIQQEISVILSNSLCYWVSPWNLGVEYAVFKWPDDIWRKNNTTQIIKTLKLIDCPVFDFSIYGIQINPDGCVIAKGYDAGGSIFNIRKKMKQDLSFLPEKQSNWAHIPLGRILEPIDTKKFTKLRSFVRKYKDKFIVEDTLTSVKYVHETRWYMEEKNILLEVNFKR